MEKHLKKHFWNFALFTRFNLTIVDFFCLGVPTPKAKTLSKMALNNFKLNEMSTGWIKTHGAGMGGVRPNPENICHV